MSAQRCCFVLWGEQCDEVAAVLFITNLRAVGLRVWVVGIGGKRNNGAHGLAFVTDMALDEALPLASQTAAVIIPGRIEQWVHFLNDPRLVELLTNCVDHQAQIVMAESLRSPQVTLAQWGLQFLQGRIVLYPSGTILHAFTQSFAAHLGRNNDG